ncbi:GPW/gp25 family protein [Bacteroidales bacterium OttesenSCG-928-A17]|nr:GPW/gp25 family protein [Bacteroidales bacterium OttesenSCG-928-A17]
MKNGMNDEVVKPIRSWSFPIEFRPTINPTQMVSGEENIRQSLQILFSTILGERVHRPYYGYSFREIVFESNTLSTRVLIINNIKRAVAIHEPRIKVDEVLIESQSSAEGILEIQLSYTIVQNEMKGFLTYSFIY